MSKQWIIILFFLIYGREISAYAPTQVGGGGYVIKCTDDLENHQWYTYDIWEQSNLFKNVNQGLEGDTWDKKVSFALVRIKRFEPFWGNELLNSFRELKNDFSSALIPRIIIPDFKDYNDIFGVPGCTKIPAAMQLRRPLLGQRKFYFSKNVWARLSEYHKATLVLHELLYQSFISYQKVDVSDFVRYFNFVISSDLMEDINLEEYFNYKFSREKLVINTIKKSVRRTFKIIYWYLDENKDFRKREELEANATFNPDKLIKYLPVFLVNANIHFDVFEMTGDIDYRVNTSMLLNMYPKERDDFNIVTAAASSQKLLKLLSANLNYRELDNIPIKNKDVEFYQNIEQYFIGFLDIIWSEFINQQSVLN